MSIDIINKYYKKFIKLIKSGFIENIIFLLRSFFWRFLVKKTGFVS